ncbi:Putative O-methyltransferase [bacterium HR17]|uniref:O-methyltransferase n=1 Tax=Candidatus Fervidibacter japonicus TaxID=2035412 RepID=A0A2H5XDB4_9BACT|nr:Putative O-methyltransferase [bacterium HR17]
MNALGVQTVREINRRRFLLASAGSLGWLTLSAQSPSPRDRAETIEPLLRELETMRAQFANVPRSDGQFLNLLVKASRAKRVLEVGTSNGYSAIWLSLALEETDGHLTTIEILPERVKLAKENLKRAGLAHRVTFLQGDAHQIVPTLKGPFDFVFLDADKGRERDYFGYLYPDKLPKGSLLVVHNAIRFRKVMQPFLDLIARHPEFDSLIVSTTLDDGFSVNYRRKG